MSTIQPLNIFGDLFFGDVNVFILTMFFVIGVITLWARSLSVMAASIFMLLTKIQMETDLFIYDSLVYGLFAIGIVILALRIWTYSTEGQGT